MAITSYFYNGPVTGLQWGVAQPGVGDRFWVEHDTAGKVSVLSGTTIQFAVGRIGGGGIVDDITVAETFEIPTPASDGVRYWTAGALRTWQTTNATTLTAVEGTSTRFIAAGLDDDPGTIDFQPLALVRVEKSGATITASVSDDLRLVGTKGRFEGYSERALVVGLPRGTVVRIAGTDWLRKADGSWEKIDRAVEIVTSGVYSSESPFNGVGLQTYLVRDGRHRHLFIEQSAFNSAQYGATSGSNDIADVQTLTLANSRDFPAHTTDVMVKYNYSESGAWAVGAGVLYPAGGFHLTNLTPGLPFRGRGIGGPGWDLRFTVEYWSATP